MEEKRGESKYAKRLAIRRSWGKDFISLSKNEAENGGRNPMPTPCTEGYVPSHTPKMTGDWKNNPVLKHENKGFLGRIKTRFQYPLPKNLRVSPTIKYDHFLMNYHGWDR